MSDKKISPVLKLNGWKFKKWFLKNKDSIKTLTAGVLGLVAASFPENIIVQLCFGAGAGYVTKLILDTVDFYVSEVKL